MSTSEHQSDVDPFMCTCGPCKKFWKDNFSEAADLLRRSSISRAQDTSVINSKNRAIKVGDRVAVHGKYPVKGRVKSAGTVKFVGVVDDNAIAPNLYVGVKLDENVNSVHNGLHKGKRYFHCPPGHGAMVRYTEVKLLKTPAKTPPINNNYMFPSWEEVKQRRKERNQKLADIYARAGVSPSSSSVFSEPAYRPTSSLRVKSEPVINVNDPHDIAIKDQEKRRLLELSRQHARENDQERNELKKIKQQFGGGPEADRMAQTFLKLQKAYQDGLALTNRRGMYHELSSNDDD